METEYEKILRLLRDTQMEISVIDEELEKIAASFDTLADKRKKLLDRVDLLNKRKFRVFGQ